MPPESPTNSFKLPPISHIGQFNNIPFLNNHSSPSNCFSLENRITPSYSNHYSNNPSSNTQFPHQSHSSSVNQNITHDPSRNYPSFGQASFDPVNKPSHCMDQLHINNFNNGSININNTTTTNKNHNHNHNIHNNIINHISSNNNNDLPTNNNRFDSAQSLVSNSRNSHPSNDHIDIKRSASNHSQKSSLEGFSSTKSHSNYRYVLQILTLLLLNPVLFFFFFFSFFPFFITFIIFCFYLELIFPRNPFIFNQVLIA